jgi:endonuclease/exonuclease/phosphatase (EEP) superfamily protein YafD
VGTIAPHLQITSHVTLIAAASSPYLMLTAPLSVAVIVLLLNRRWPVVALTAAFVAVAVISQTGTNASEGKTSAQATPLRVMTANMMLGSADPNALVKTAAHSADIVALQELTPEAVGRLQAANLESSFPYRFVYPVEGGGGTGLWSLYPLLAPTIVRGFAMVFIKARINLGRNVDAPWLLVAHLAGPWPQAITGWNQDMDALRTTMDATAKVAGDDSVIIVGDFNSTIDMQPFRQLLQNGYVDAAQSTGARTILTFPQGAPIPPFLGIDHALIRNCSATAVRAVPSPGSDHRALLVDIDVPMR